MSYPDPVYLGVGGDVSARARAAGEPPDLRLGDRVEVHYLATGATTDGLFGLYRWEMAARSGGAAPHFHRAITESFYVLRGAVRLYDGRDWVDAGPGDFLHVPIGGIHGFANESDEAASMLLHFAPGAPREGYFERLPQLATMDDEDRAAFFVEHDNHYL